MTTAQLEQHEIVLTIPKEITSPETVAELRAAAIPHFEAASPLCVAARQIVVSDEGDTAGMAKAKETRLAIKAVRVAADKARVSLKDESLRKGQAIDGVFNGLRDALKMHEDYLQAQEEFAQRLESARRRELKLVRDQRLAAMGVDQAAYNTDMMTDEAFESCMAGVQAQQRAAKEAAEKAEQERIAKAKADAEAREAQRVENERLKAEAAEREKQHTAEREAARKERETLERKQAEERERARVAQRVAEAKAELERQQREKVEREQREREAAEAKRKADEVVAAERAANAPDKEKLLAWADELTALEPPQLSTPKTRKMAQSTIDGIRGIADALRTAANRL